MGNPRRKRSSKSSRWIINGIYKSIKYSKIIKDFPASLEDLAKCEPIYEELEGWTEDITTVEKFEDLPENAKKYVAKIEELVGVSVDMVSVGPNRAQTIVRKNIF